MYRLKHVKCLEIVRCAQIPSAASIAHTYKIFDRELIDV